MRPRVRPAATAAARPEAGSCGWTTRCRRPPSSSARAAPRFGALAPRRGPGALEAWLAARAAAAAPPRPGDLRAGRLGAPATAGSLAARAQPQPRPGRLRPQEKLRPLQAAAPFVTPPGSELPWRFRAAACRRRSLRSSYLPGSRPPVASHHSVNTGFESRA